MRIGGGRYCSEHGTWLANAHMDICEKCVKEDEEKRWNALSQEARDMYSNMADKLKEKND